MKTLIALIIAAGLAVVCGRIGRCAGGGGLPQLGGGDLLSVVFGDARSVLSRAAYHQADSYFHGGIEIEAREVRSGSSRSPDLWAWINRHVRAPQEHRHLEGVSAREVMPWFWASVRSDPHNVEAWQAAWYAAAHIMKDRELAARVLEEAKAKNPESAEIALTEGQFLYDGGRGETVMAKIAFEKAERLAEEGSQTREFARRYLRNIEKNEARP